MYAKLFSRIAQSSLMEEKVTTRYVFMMLLALSDRHGEVIGTDIAIARMMNVPKDDFCESLKPLLEPDPDSNSPAEEGRRVIASESGRGYKIVNYTAYRDIKSDDEKRQYMRQYMRQRRQKDKETVENVTDVNPCKVLLNDVTHTEADTEVKAEAKHITHHKASECVIESPFLDSPPEAAKTMQQLMSEINKLRPSWGKLAVWTRSEMEQLRGGTASQMQSLADDDWQLLKAYFESTQDGYFRPDNRSKFCESFSGIWTACERWKKATQYRAPNSKDSLYHGS